MFTQKVVAKSKRKLAIEFYARIESTVEHLVMTFEEEELRRYPRGRRPVPRGLAARKRASK
jgi:hypothetical protein